MFDQSSKQNSTHFIGQDTNLTLIILDNNTIFHHLLEMLLGTIAAKGINLVIAKQIALTIIRI